MLQLNNKMRIKKRGALEISFGWLFAIFAGIAILGLAIFFVTKFINLQQTVISAETGKQIGILLNPLETSFQSSTTTSFSIPGETIINNICSEDADFGNQEISLSQKSFGKWTETDVDVSFKNKYIFSDSEVEGRNFYIFSKPFEYPFKVADLIYLTSSLKEYCFLGSPPEIENELKNLNQTNILLEDCSDEDNSIKICFFGTCDINVDYTHKTIRKEGKTLHFDNAALMYAGIFSDVNIYECQLKRLMKRISELSSLYENKAILISQKGCPTSLGDELTQLKDFAESFDNSADLVDTMNSFVADLNRGNDISLCKLW